MNLKTVSLSFVFVSLACVRAFAADAGGATDERTTLSLRSDNSYTLEEQRKESEGVLKKKSEEAKSPPFLFGGTLSSSYRYYKNLDNTEEEEDFLRWSWRQDFYFWAYYNYKDTCIVYARIFNSYIDRGVGATYTGIGADYEGPVLSALLAKIDLKKINSLPATVTLGRQSLRVGRGIVYSDTHDGAQAEISSGNFYAKFFGARARPREDNIDFSVPGFDKEGQRVFWGSEAAYAGIPKTVVYGYALMQKDQSSENTDDPLQSFHYDSHYLGAGFSAKFQQNEVWGETAMERGQGFTDTLRTSLQKSKIKSWMGLVGAKHRSPAETHPIFETEFAMGSGDDDRRRVTNAVGGDLDGHDYNFLYFGSYAAGYALQPQMSNIRIWTLGASFQPFEKWAALKDFAAGTKHYFYWKDRADGLISDPESSGTNSYLGEEWDFYLHWKATESLRWIMRYGIFLPDDGYPDGARDNTEYFFLSTSYSF